MKRFHIVIGSVSLAFIGWTIYLFAVRLSDRGKPFRGQSITEHSLSSGSSVSNQGLSQTPAGSPVFKDPIAQGYFAAVQTPISFWGRVVDEDGKPIAGASVSVSVNDKIFKNATHHVLESNVEGQFSLTNVKGLSVSISVSKPGYSQSETSKGVCGYAVHAGTDIPIPTASAPAIFMLRKRGVAAELAVRSENVPVTGDGKPITVNLAGSTNATSRRYNVIVQTWVSKPIDSNGHYTWTGRISVPGGGIRPRDDTLNFNAPENGYADSETMTMDAKASSWSPQGSGEYFVKLPDNHYARLSIRIVTNGDRFVTIVSYVNSRPNSRNLEYDPAKQIASGKK